MRKCTFMPFPYTSWKWHGRKQASYFWKNKVFHFHLEVLLYSNLVTLT
jgi:hypothetical protein